MAEKKNEHVQKTLRMVKTTEPVQFFGINGTQISSTMQGIKLVWDGDKVVVTSHSNPGEEKWIFPATIAFMGWKVDE
mgnify:CR=1 FL=1